jgi:hypothetical protein
MLRTPIVEPWSAGHQKPARVYPKRANSKIEKDKRERGKSDGTAGFSCQATRKSEKRTGMGLPSAFGLISLICGNYWRQ